MITKRDLRRARKNRSGFETKYLLYEGSDLVLETDDYQELSREYHGRESSDIKAFNTDSLGRPNEPGSRVVPASPGIASKFKDHNE